MIRATSKTTANETKITQLKGIKRSRTKANDEEKIVKHFLKNSTSGRMGFTSLAAPNPTILAYVVNNIRSDEIGGRISREEKTSTIDGNRFLDSKFFEKKKKKKKKEKNKQRTVTRRYELDRIEKRIWWPSIMR